MKPTIYGPRNATFDNRYFHESHMFALGFALLEPTLISLLFKITGFINLNLFWIRFNKEESIFVSVSLYSNSRYLVIDGEISSILPYLLTVLYRHLYLQVQLRFSLFAII